MWLDVLNVFKVILQVNILSERTWVGAYRPNRVTTSPSTFSPQAKAGEQRALEEAGTCAEFVV